MWMPRIIHMLPDGIFSKEEMSEMSPFLIRHKEKKGSVNEEWIIRDGCPYWLLGCQ